MGKNRTNIAILRAQLSFCTKTNAPIWLYDTYYNLKRIKLNGTEKKRYNLNNKATKKAKIRGKSNKNKKIKKNFQKPIDKYSNR